MAKRRPNGDGLVRKRDDGRWEGRIVAGHKKDGSPIYRAVFAEKQSELMPKLHQLKEQYAGGELTEDSSITLGNGSSAGWKKQIDVNNGVTFS